MIVRRALVFLMAGLSTDLNAEVGLSRQIEDREAIQSRTPNSRVSLAYQLRRGTPLQRGETCHIYSAIALVEAACFRRTGKRPNLSEASALACHLKDQTQFELEPDSWLQVQLTPWERGYSEHTIQRILNREICTRNGFPMKDAEFFAALNDLASKQAEGHRRMMEKIKDPKGDFQWMTDEERLNTLQTSYFHYMKRLKREIDQWIDVVTKQQATQPGKDLLDQCLSPDTKIRELPFSHLSARELLESGRPFICSGHFHSLDSNHASLVIGFQENSRFNGDTEYQLRDSNSKRPEWGWELHCDRMIYLD